MIAPALLDVPCPMCDAAVGELCTALGREMESTVHAPRRIRAGVAIDKEPEPKTPKEPKAHSKPKRPKTARPKGPRTHCVNNHEYTEANTYLYKGTRKCRTCNTAHKRRSQEQKTPNPGTHCRSGGHEFTPENTYTQPDGQRRCRTCKRERDNRSNAKRRAAA